MVVRCRYSLSLISVSAKIYLSAAGFSTLMKCESLGTGLGEMQDAPPLD